MIYCHLQYQLSLQFAIYIYIFIYLFQPFGLNIYIYLFQLFGLMERVIYLVMIEACLAWQLFNIHNIISLAIYIIIITKYIPSFQLFGLIERVKSLLIVYGPFS
jgi:hypothetical protein